MLSAETIVAPVTPPGEGGVGIVRLSGASAVALLSQAFTGETPDRMMSHRLYLGHLRHPGGCAIDQVLAVVMKGPHSYTGEDVVEVHCHGGVQIMRQTVDLFLDLGARMASPGEFTQRAFLNGRLDLAQAEAVAGLIGARSAEAGRIALGQLDGRLSRLLHRFTETLKLDLALVEAHIDFPDDEVGNLDLAPLQQKVVAIQGEMQQLLASFDTGRVLREGLNLLILGRPNVGKSSLMNALLGESRAIVTDVPGTTRDTLEEQMVLGGFPVRLIDTAGVRETDDPVEQQGVQRARDKVALADLVLLVVDGSVVPDDEDRLAFSLCDPQKTLLVYNKADCPAVAVTPELTGLVDQVAVSAKTGEGLDLLGRAVVAFFEGEASGELREDLLLTERRHRDALLRAKESLVRFVGGLTGGAPLECLALELREALSALGLITGETTPDEILDQIFSRFCIGK